MYGRHLTDLRLVAVLATVALRAAVADESIDYFETHIRPVLVESCASCHFANDGEVQGEFAVDNRESMRRGGKSGKAIAPGSPDESRLLTALRYENAALRMPPDGKLPDDVIEHFRKWIAMGAPDPRDGAVIDIDSIAQRAKSHWAFQPPIFQEPPVDDSGWSRRPLDQFVRATLASAELRPVEEADRRTLAKRLYFDFDGLPPTYEQIEEFALDDRPDAYEALVDRLLDSPQFGERWARHWLDVARYADSKGYVFKEERDIKNAYKFRDWVIAAFNDNLPINQFLHQQIYASPELTVAASDDQLAALGFLTLGRRFLGQQDDIIADRIDVVARGMMGVTIGCARCHDHKYDPFSIEDYYGLYGVFASTSEPHPEGQPPLLQDKLHPENVGVFLRGSRHNRGAIVERGVPTFFAADRGNVTDGSGRRELANTIVSDDNPLTARVFVNRVWGHLTGKPLVSTPSDFGLRCPPPVQQPLLDSLTVDFVNHGWSLKWLVREITTSSTYRLSSQPTHEQLAVDAENDLLGRAHRRGRDFEAMRDAILFVGDRLDTSQVGGRSEPIDTIDGGTRRTLYAYIDRQNLPSLFRTFDFASPDAHCPQRPTTLVPQQALFLLNSSIVQGISEKSVTELADSPVGERINQLYRAVLQRDPTDDERQLATQFVAGRIAEPAATNPWSYGLCNAANAVDGSSIDFQPLQHYSDSKWQQAQEFPHAEFGYLSITADGGHPGRLAEHAAVRRWTSPSHGKLHILGEVTRPESKGDGIQVIVTSSRRGLLGEWQLSTGKQEIKINLPNVNRGETIDFVVASGGNDAYDSFQLPLRLSLRTPDGMQVFDSRQGFHGPLPTTLDVWAQFVQVLLASNEFAFVD